MADKDLHRILELTEEAQDFFTQNKPISAAQTLGNLGVLYRKAGDPAKALECSKIALNIFHQLGEQESEAMELLLQANTYGSLKDYENAINCHMQSLKIADELGNELLVAMNCLRVGLIMAVGGMYAEARVMLRYATLLYSTLGQHSYLADALGAIEKFRTAKLFSNEPEDAALDKFFSAGSSLENIRRAVEEHPLLLTSRLIRLLDNANEVTIGIRCVVAAINKQVAMLRLVTPDERRT